MDNQTLKQGLKSIIKDKQGDIPLLVKLLENPKSPIALPGKISFYNHDCLYVLLDRKLSSSDEAFIIGFTMGSDPNTKSWHIKIFKFFSRYLYPKEYKFSPEHFINFDLGFDYGKKLKIKFNKIDFFGYEDYFVSDLRKRWGISEVYLDFLKHAEKQQIYELSKRKSKRKLRINPNILKYSSCFFALLGGLMVSSNSSFTPYGFIFLAGSSSQMLLASLLIWDIFMTFYFSIIFFFVDLFGIHSWLIK